MGVIPRTKRAECGSKPNEVCENLAEDDVQRLGKRLDLVSEDQNRADDHDRTREDDECDYGGSRSPFPWGECVSDQFTDRQGHAVMMTPGRGHLGPPSCSSVTNT